MAERVGFEPTVPGGTHALQACTFVHSVTSPLRAGNSLQPTHRGVAISRPVFQRAGRGNEITGKMKGFATFFSGTGKGEKGGAFCDMGSWAGSIGGWDGRTRTSTDEHGRNGMISCRTLRFSGLRGIAPARSGRLHRPARGIAPARSGDCTGPLGGIPLACAGSPVVG